MLALISLCFSILTASSLALPTTNCPDCDKYIDVPALTLLPLIYDGKQSKVPKALTESIGNCKFLQDRSYT